MRELLERTKALLISLQWTGHNGNGCETCDYDSAMCPSCCANKESEGFRNNRDGSGHYKNCELMRTIKDTDTAIEQMAKGESK